MARISEDHHEDLGHVVHEIDRIVPNDAEPWPIWTDIALDQFLKPGWEFGIDR